jgi:hypothetical protein
MSCRPTGRIRTEPATGLTATLTRTAVPLLRATTALTRNRRGSNACGPTLLQLSAG